MIEKIKQLEAIALKLEPDAVERSKIRQQVIDYAERFLQSIDSNAAYQVTEDKGAALLDYPVDEQPKDIQQLVGLIQENVDRPGLNPASGGHLAYIPGGGLYPAALGDYLADVTNRYAGVFYANPGAVRIENSLIQWMCALFGFPATAGGNLTSGGSMANLIAIVTARDHKQLHARDFEKAVIYCSAQVHHCTKKSIKVAGLYDAQLRVIPMDSRFRLDSNALKLQIEQDLQNGLQPFMVMASAGTTDTGAIDPLDSISQLCKAYDLWMHVDAAYGGFFILTEEIKKKMKGIEQADSIVIDPHKGLFLPYGSGAVIIREAKWLYDSQHMQANYMQDTFDDIEELSPADMSPELTKPFRGLRMWLPLQLFGVAPFRAALSEKLWLCRYFYEEIQKIDGFEVGPYPELSVMIYRYVPTNKEQANAYNLELVNRVKADGRVFLSSTTIDGTIYLRLAVLSFRTHLKTIDTCLQVLAELTQNETVSKPIA